MNKRSVTIPYGFQVEAVKPRCKNSQQIHITAEPLDVDLLVATKDEAARCHARLGTRYRRPSPGTRRVRPYRPSRIVRNIPIRRKRLDHMLYTMPGHAGYFEVHAPTGRPEAPALTETLSRTYTPCIVEHVTHYHPSGVVTLTARAQNGEIFGLDLHPAPGFAPYGKYVHDERVPAYLADLTSEVLSELRRELLPKVGLADIACVYACQGVGYKTLCRYVTDSSRTLPLIVLNARNILRVTDEEVVELRTTVETSITFGIALALRERAGASVRSVNAAEQAEEFASHWFYSRKVLPAMAALIERANAA
jgi:hypothetical protein